MVNVLLILSTSFGVLLVLAARDHPLDYLGNLAYGAGWLLAAGPDHLDDAIFDSRDLIQNVFEIGIMVCGLTLAVVSHAVWREQQR